MIILRGEQIVVGEYADNNRIVGTPQATGGSVVEFKGSNCTVTFGLRSRLSGKISLRGDDSHVAIGKRSEFRGQMSLGFRCEVTLGNNIYCGTGAYLTTAEGASIRLGNDLLISDRFQVRADDSHPLYDGVTGERINHSQSVTVGDHVWIGADVILMPGSEVGDGAVIGIRSLVTKSRPVPSHSLAIGAPVQVHRRNIHWVRKHLQTDDDIAGSIAPIFTADRLQPPDPQARSDFGP